MSLVFCDLSLIGVTQKTKCSDTKVTSLKTVSGRIYEFHRNVPAPATDSLTHFLEGI